MRAFEGDPPQFRIYLVECMARFRGSFDYFWNSVGRRRASFELKRCRVRPGPISFAQVSSRCGFASDRVEFVLLSNKCQLDAVGSGIVSGKC